MNRFKLAVVVTAFMLATVPSVAQDVDLEFVLQGIKYNDSLSKNCGVKISYIVEVATYPEGRNALRDWISKDPEASLPPLLQGVERKRYEYDCILRGGESRVEAKEYEYSSIDGQDTEILLQHLLWTYDGEKTRYVAYPSKYWSELQGIMGTDIGFFRWEVPLVFDDFLGRNVTFPSDYPDMKLVGKTRIDKHDCYLIEGNYKYAEASKKIWVAPEFGFRPIKIESCSERFEGIQKTDYERYNGIWAIKHQIFQSFFKIGNEKLRGSERKLTVNKIEFICPPKELPDSVFELEFPRELKTIWDADMEISIDNPLSEEDEEDTTAE